MIAPVTSGSSATDKGNTTWIVRAGPANSGCVSSESANTPGSDLRHYACRLHLQPHLGTSQFAAATTLCAQPGNGATSYALHSFDHPAKYVRHHRFAGYLASDGGANARDNPSSWAQDARRLVAAPWS